MATLEERVVYLEGRGQEQAVQIAEVRADIRDVRADIRDVRTELRDFRVEVNRRFEDVDGRFDRLETRFDTRFMWMIGFQFATLMAVIAALLNVYFR